MAINTKKQGLANLLRGQAGVLRVASELLIRGVNVYFPTQDVGTDLITEEGLRVQVKSASLRERPMWNAKREMYFFACMYRSVGNTASAQPKRYRRRDFSAVDVVVLWCIEDDQFYIVPSRIFAKRQSLALFPRRKRGFQGRSQNAEEVYACLDRWDLLVPLEQPAVTTAIEEQTHA